MHGPLKAPVGNPQVLQDLVRAIRNSRAEYGVDLGMRIPATLVIENDALRWVPPTCCPVSHPSRDEIESKNLSADSSP